MAKFTTPLLALRARLEREGRSHEYYEFMKSLREFPIQTDEDARNAGFQSLAHFWSMARVRATEIQIERDVRDDEPLPFERF